MSAPSKMFGPRSSSELDYQSVSRPIEILKEREAIIPIFQTDGEVMIRLRPADDELKYGAYSESCRIGMKLAWAEGE